MTFIITKEGDIIIDFFEATKEESEVVRELSADIELLFGNAIYCG